MVPPSRWPSVLALAVFVGLPCGLATAQGPASTSGGYNANGGVPARPGSGGMRVAANYRQDPETPPAPPPPPTPTAPAEAGSGPERPANQPGPNETDLTIPRAEKGEEPTTEEAAEEAAAAPSGPPNLLMKALGTEEAYVKMYGWIQNSYTGNTNGTPANRSNFGVNPNNLANSWQGNQYYLILEHTVEQNDKINFGFRFDNLFGNDWQFNHMKGLFDTSFQLNHFAGYDPAQMYAEVHLPFLTKGGIDIKGGRWYALAGYEVVPATGRPLLSVPYMFNYGQPFTHFGVLSTWHLTDKINIYNAAINGWDRWVDSNYKWGYTGGFSWTFNDDKTSWTTILVWGPNQFPNFLPANTLIVPTGATPTPFLAGRRNPGYGANDRTLFTTVVSHKWSDKLTQVVETDQGFENNIPGTGPNGTNQNASWYSFGNWFLYGINDKLTGVWRSEIFRDNNGVRTGFATDLNEMTLGLIYKPKNWLWVRPEARYDWASHAKPYNDGTRGSQLTLAFDVIVLF